MKIRPLACLLTALLLPLTAQADGERLAYSCDNGSRFDIGFSAPTDGRPQATLYFADGPVVLPQVPAASGALYRDGEIRLHTQGDEAQLEDGKGNRRLCRRGDTPPPSPVVSAAPSSFLDIAGNVAYHTRQALPPDAVLVVRIVDRSRGLTLAEQRSELAGRQVPIPFATTIDRDLLGKKSRVFVSARIERHGRPLLVSDAYPALRDGQPQTIDIQLKPVKRGTPR